MALLLLFALTIPLLAWLGARIYNRLDGSGAHAFGEAPGPWSRHDHSARQTTTNDVWDAPFPPTLFESALIEDDAPFWHTGEVHDIFGYDAGGNNLTEVGILGDSIIEYDAICTPSLDTFD